MCFTGSGEGPGEITALTGLYGASLGPTILPARLMTCGAWEGADSHSRVRISRIFHRLAGLEGPDKMTFQA